MESQIRVAIFPPLEEVRFESIENDLPTVQRIVGGDIELLALGAGLCLICNENGKSTGLAANRVVVGPGGRDWIVGTFFVARVDGPEFASVEERDVTPLENWKPGGVWRVWQIPELN